MREKKLKSTVLQEQESTFLLQNVEYKFHF